MSRRKLSLEVQLDILKDAKNRYKFGEINKPEYLLNFGMCFYIDKALYKQTSISMSFYGNLKYYLPTFSLMHIAKITKGTDLYPTTFLLKEYWWNEKEIDVRLKVFDLLINELEKQIAEK